MSKHFLSINDLTKEEITEVIKNAIKLKSELYKKGANPEYLKNKSMAMIFEKPSLRTRLSFEIGMTQLGGHAIYLGPNDIGLGTRESIPDIGTVTSSMADIIMARTFKHETLIELAKYSQVPVINALSDLEHPCQILADLQTIYEQTGKLSGLTIAFVGDGNNNVTHSFALAATKLGMHFKYASPKGYQMNKVVESKAKEIAKANKLVFEASHNPLQVLKNTDVVVTDTWVSMGQESEKDKRLSIFKNYQITSKLMSMANSGAIFMHCLPAHRGYEVSSDVIDGPQSVVFQEAENRLHAQKALILFLINIDINQKT